MEMQLKVLRDGIAASIEVKQAILADSALLKKILDVANLVADAEQRGNRTLFAGNGGSAADAQHLAAEFVSRFEFDRPGLPSLSLATDTSMLTAIGNDYGYENLFKRQLQAQGRAGDVFIGITTSGRSRNILEAFSICQTMGITSVCLCGAGGNLEGQVDHVLRVPSAHTARIQESHIMIGHLICGLVEQKIFSHLRS